MVDTDSTARAAHSADDYREVEVPSASACATTLPRPAASASASRSPAASTPQWRRLSPRVTSASSASPRWRCRHAICRPAAAATPRTWRALRIELRVLSIEPAFAAYLNTLVPVFADRPLNTPEANLQRYVERSERAEEMVTTHWANPGSRQGQPGPGEVTRRRRRASPTPQGGSPFRQPSGS